jgi:hypothetical protein
LVRAGQWQQLLDERLVTILFACPRVICETSVRATTDVADKWSVLARKIHEALAGADQAVVIV